MKKRNKVALLSMSAVLLVAASVMGTMAYLTDKDSVENTFTVGKVQLTLDEFDYDYDTDTNPGDSFELNGEKRDKSNVYHLLPGMSYKKDPTVTVLDNSEDAYVRMMVEVEGLDKLKEVFKDSKYYAGDVFLLQTLTPDWNDEAWPYYAFHSDTNTYEFRYKEVVSGGSDEDTPDNRLEPLFALITVPGEDVTNDNIKNLEEVSIKVTAHAIQAAGFEDSDTAWAAFDQAYVTQ